MELPADIVGIIAACDPVAFLCVSKFTRARAIAAITAEVTVLRGGVVMYQGSTYCVRLRHDCSLFDVLVRGRDTHCRGLCDLNVAPHTRCNGCTKTEACKPRWLSAKCDPVKLHYREAIIMITAAAAGWCELPAGFGD